MDSRRSSVPRGAVDWLRTRLQVPQVEVPEGRLIELPGRGRTWVTDIPGPPDASTVILLHAVGCTGALTWFPAMAELAKTYRVITFDQRWHGQGIKSDHFDVADCADDLAALISTLGLEKPIIAGYSMGGIIAQRTWRRHPKLVGGLVLAATTSHFRTTTSEVAFHQGMEMSMRALNLLARSSVARAAGSRTARALQVPPTQTGQWALAQWNSTSPWTVAQAVASLGRHNSGPWLRKVDVPTAVVVTTRDRVVPAERQRHLAWSVPGATVHEAACGHAGCVLEASIFVPALVQAVDSVRLRLMSSPQTATRPAQR
jgi:pimeloyl-ACP methyl ester carboxylesterase